MGRRDVAKWGVGGPPRGMLRGRRTVVPGTATKALATGGRHVPRSILLGAARRATGGGNRG